MTSATQTTVTIDDVYSARDRLASLLPRTPLLSSRTIGQMTGTTLRLKAENLQRTGSFKVRGALNAVLQLSPEQRAQGAVTFSAGNHGQSLAYAAAASGVRCTVFMARNAVPAKVEAIRGYGAEVRFGANIGEAFEAMEVFRRETGATFVSPFADPAVIAGQGTVALEILEDFPEVEQLVVPVGGGGLLCGVALTAKALRPDIRVVGVEPEGSTAVLQGLRAGQPVRIERNETIADGLSAPFTGELVLALTTQHVDDMITVTDDEIADALRLLLARTKLLAEPAGAAAVAALLTGKAAVPHGANTVAILSGGNVGLDRLKALL
ncbi:MAG: threonine dehydratase [Thermomicrobiales bacterium]|jgi:threonine dehydratase|nr:threonine dehydratase [Thermomicrobiales bacterium]